MDAYSRADQRARRYLMNLWLFESNIDDSTLLAASRGQDAGRALAAKEALQHLWTDDRLAPRTRQAIIQEYFRPELRAMMVSTNAGPYCVMTLVARPDFPFDGTPLAWRSDIKVGDAKPNLGEWIGSQDNQYTNREIVIGRGGDGPFEKPVTVHASLEVGIGMNQTNAQPTCIAHWDLGPLAPHAEIDPSGGAATRPGER
jgi:hypothetical protein